MIVQFDKTVHKCYAYAHTKHYDTVYFILYRLIGNIHVRL